MQGIDRQATDSRIFVPLESVEIDFWTRTEATKYIKNKPGSDKSADWTREAFQFNWA